MKIVIYHFFIFSCDKKTSFKKLKLNKIKDDFTHFLQMLHSEPLHLDPNANFY
jgi:hypothetical protein